MRRCVRSRDPYGELFSNVYNNISSSFSSGQELKDIAVASREQARIRRMATDEREKRGLYMLATTLIYIDN